MKTGVLESSCELSPPETRAWYFLGINLNIDLHYAKKGEFVKGSSTIDVCDFFLKAEKKGREESYLPLVLSDDICCVTTPIRSTELSLKINDYFIYEKGIKTIDEFYDDYLPFVTSCRKVTRNILKAPKVRLSWDNNLMINDTETYQDFINYPRFKCGLF